MIAGTIRRPGDSTAAAVTAASLRAVRRSSSHVAIQLVEPAGILATGPAPTSVGDGGSVTDHRPHVRIVASDDGTVSFTVGVAALFPFYVWREGHDVVGFSWRLEDAIAAGHHLLDAQTVGEYLGFRQRYTYRTLLKDVYQLTERATITVSATGIDVALPEGHRSPAPSEVRDDRAAARALIDVLDFAVSDFSGPDASLVHEVSGGRDSSLLALLPSARGRRSFGIHFPEPAGTRQAWRRQRIAALAGQRDTPSDGTALLEGGVDLLPVPFDPRADLYGPLTVAAINAAGCRGAQIVNGIGGDDILLDVPHQETDSASDRSAMESYDLPKTRLPETALMAACGRFAFFQSVGCWPVYPYIHPEVVDFASRLPRRLLQGRTLQMLALEDRGADRDLMARSIPENFETLMRMEAAKHGLPSANDSVDDCGRAMRARAMQTFIQTNGLEYNESE